MEIRWVADGFSGLELETQLKRHGHRVGFDAPDFDPVSGGADGDVGGHVGGLRVKVTILDPDAHVVVDGKVHPGKCLIGEDTVSGRAVKAGAADDDFFTGQHGRGHPEACTDIGGESFVIRHMQPGVQQQGDTGQRTFRYDGARNGFDGVGGETGLDFRREPVGQTITRPHADPDSGFKIDLAVGHEGLPKEFAQFDIAGAGAADIGAQIESVLFGRCGGEDECRAEAKTDLEEIVLVIHSLFFPEAWTLLRMSLFGKTLAAAPHRFKPGFQTCVLPV